MLALRQQCYRQHLGVTSKTRQKKGLFGCFMSFHTATFCFKMFLCRVNGVKERINIAEYFLKFINLSFDTWTIKMHTAYLETCQADC